MNDENANHHENSNYDSSSSDNDENFLNNIQIPQIDKNFEDINEFWNSTPRNITQKHATFSNTNLSKSPHLIAPSRLGTNPIFSYQPTPPRSFQNSPNKFYNSPIYVGTSTEETPRRSNSSESHVSSDDQSNDDSSSSDGLTFIDTPIPERSNPSPLKNKGNDRTFKLSPLTSNKNEKFVEKNSDESYSDVYSSTDSDILIKKERNEQINPVNLPESQVIHLEIPDIDENPNIPTNNISNPIFSISSGSDVEENQIKSKNNLHSHFANSEQILNTNIQQSNNKKQSASKPAFASPKRISNGQKKETIITELSPSTSMRRKKVESPRISDFRLSKLEQEEEEVNENKLVTTQESKSNIVNLTENAGNSFVNYKDKELNVNSDNYLINNIKNNDSSDENDNDDDDIKKIERLAKKDPLHTKKIDALIMEEKHENQDDIKLEQPKAQINQQSKARTKQKVKSKSQSSPKTENESIPQKKNAKVTKESPAPKFKSKAKAKSDSNPQTANLSDKSESTSSKTKSESQPLKTKTKTKAKSQPESQPQKSKTKKQNSPKIKYDFTISSSDDDSSLVQIPEDFKIDQKDGKNSANDQDNSDLPIALRRRKRVIVKPLKFWCGERIVYGLSEDGFQTFQNLSIPEKMRKLAKGEVRLMAKEQKRFLPKKECKRKLSRVEGNGMVVFENKVIDFDKSNEVVLEKGVKCSVVCKGDLPLIFKVEEI